MACIAYQHLPSRAAAGLVEAPAVRFILLCSGESCALSHVPNQEASLRNNCGGNVGLCQRPPTKEETLPDGPCKHLFSIRT